LGRFEYDERRVYKYSPEGKVNTIQEKNKLAAIFTEAMGQPYDPLGIVRH
jgi:hypothetical protein